MNCLSNIVFLLQYFHSDGKLRWKRHWITKLSLRRQRKPGKRLRIENKCDSGTSFSDIGTHPRVSYQPFGSFHSRGPMLSSSSFASPFNKLKKLLQPATVFLQVLPQALLAFFGLGRALCRTIGRIKFACQYWASTSTVYFYCSTTTRKFTDESVFILKYWNAAFPSTSSGSYKYAKFCFRELKDRVEVEYLPHLWSEEIRMNIIPFPSDRLFFSDRT